MISLSLNVNDREMINRPDTKKTRLFIAAQLEALRKQLAPMLLLFSLSDLESALDDKAPSYVVDGWRKFYAAAQDLKRDIDRWAQDEKDLN